MPLYYRLRPREGDPEDRKSDKRRIAHTLLKLRAALHEHLRAPDVSGGTDHQRDSTAYLRLATWNIREFDSYKYGGRLEESLYYIAEILSHFDLIAVQEVREDRKALDQVMSILGHGWHYIATDVTEGTSGNNERMAFLFNTQKVWFRNIAGELVLPKPAEIVYPYEERLQFNAGMTIEMPAGTSLESPSDVKTYRRSGKDRLDSEVEIDLPALTKLRLPANSKLVLPHRHIVTLTDDGRVVLPDGSNIELPQEFMIKLPSRSIVGGTLQLARTPFMVSFQAGWLRLNLCTVHIYYGQGEEGVARRNEEIRALVKSLAERAASETDSDADSTFVVLGDFNIVGKDHVTMRSLNSRGFEVPSELRTLPGTNVKKDKLYDQIAFWTGSSRHPRRLDAVTRVEIWRAGVFDFFKTVFRTGEDDPSGEDESFYRSYARIEPELEYGEWRTYQMSDHLPMWAEVRIDFSDEYLQHIARAQQ